MTTAQNAAQRVKFIGILWLTGKRRANKNNQHCWWNKLVQYPVEVSIWLGILTLFSQHEHFAFVEYDLICFLKNETGGR